MIQIEIDEQVMKDLQKRAMPFVDLTPNDVIKKMLERDAEKQPTLVTLSTERECDPLPSLIGTAPLPQLDVMVLLEGKHLRGRFKGTDYYAEVKNRKYVMDGRPFNTPSAAAMDITKYPVNGWHWWKYHDSNKNQWLEIDNLRRMT